MLEDPSTADQSAKLHPQVSSPLMHSGRVPPVTADIAFVKLISGIISGIICGTSANRQQGDCCSYRSKNPVIRKILTMRLVNVADSPPVGRSVGRLLVSLVRAVIFR
jgi:hypothetical protein